ncbi:50S ribosomal protein L4 [Candidatus Dependentiae bacterium]|nr:50S ribosomal protein L4 [Candidatus Dependentiae bacterium]
MSKIVVYDVAGKEQEKVDFSIDKKENSPKTYSCAIRVLLQNWRQGTVSCKGRSDIAFSNKKPWKQKGTGRARAGSAKSPIWRKGGVVFGPQPRKRTLNINKKQNKLVLNNIFNSFENIYCLDLETEKPSTKIAFDALKNIGLNDKKVILFLPFGDEKNFASFRNIPNVRVVTFSQPNAFDLSNCSNWLFLKKDLDLFKNMVSSWN